MSEDLSAKVFCVCDHGFFLPVARRIAQTGAKVYFHNLAWLKAYPTLNEGILGDGFPEGDIELCLDFWPIKKQIDCFVFPDLGHAGLQQELRSQGFNVWGAGAGMALEQDREFFLAQLKKLGLDVPPHETIVGITALRKYLWDKEDIWIKMSTWRGSWETKHWRNRRVDGHRLHLWAVKFGGIREKVIFLCFPKIDTKLEIGADTYCIDGQWPELMLHGIEKKDEAYFSAVTKRSEMPEELTHIMDAFSPFLGSVAYRNQWSMEARVTEDKVYFLDATTRGGLPSTASQLCNMTNFPEVVYHGSKGEFVEAEYEKAFTAECMVKIHGDPGCWETVDLPPELKDWLMLSDCCEVDGMPWFPSDDDAISEIGWLCATGDTPTECARRMNELADALPDGADAAVESLADIIREVEAEEEQGIKFTEQPMPDPEVVLEPSKNDS